MKNLVTYLKESQKFLVNKHTVIKEISLAELRNNYGYENPLFAVICTCMNNKPVNGYILFSGNEKSACEWCNIHEKYTFANGSNLKPEIVKKCEDIIYDKTNLQIELKTGIENTSDDYNTIRLIRIPYNINETSKKYTKKYIDLRD